MKYTKNDEAVSPVIGVILMVAITVILAAVIAAFVFGMAGNISKTKVVAVTIARVDANTISATYQGGQDAAMLQSIGWTVDGVAATGLDGDGVAALAAVNGAGMQVLPVSNVAAATPILSIGSSATITNADNTATGKNHVIGIGHFSDGSQQVLTDIQI